MSLPVVDLDTRDPAFIADPYPQLRRLTEAGPLVHDAASGMTLVTRHAEVHAALRDRRLGRVVEPVTDWATLGLASRDPRHQAFWRLERWSLLELEPPHHRRLRGLLAQAFTPRAVSRLAAPAAELAGRLARSCMDAEDFDLLADFAQHFSVGIITQLLGIPADRSSDLLAWSHRMVRMYELATSDHEAQEAETASAAFESYVHELIGARRSRPADDLVSALIDAETEEGRLSDAEITSLVVLLLNAGHEATVNTIGNGMATLLADRESWHRVTSGDVAPEVAVEEMLRHDPPLQLFERFVLADDVELGGHRLEFGSKVALLFGAANRDPRVFAEPDRFDVARGSRSHVSFGGGLHHCIGAPLARLELTAAVTALAQVLPALELTATPVRTPAFVIRGYESVPVTR